MSESEQVDFLKKRLEYVASILDGETNDLVVAKVMIKHARAMCRLDEDSDQGKK